MSVSAINNTNNTTYTSAIQQNSYKNDADVSKAAEDEKKKDGVVYEKGTATSATKKTYAKEDVIARLKKDAEDRTTQLRSLVQQMMGNQGNKIGQADDMWKFLAKGNFTVSPEVKAQAQKDIAEDGYWGVEQTSDRIIDFANALTGGDPDKIEEMREAFKKGYKQAEKTWGGELPDISKRTYDAVMEKFDKMAEEAGLTTSN